MKELCFVDFVAMIKETTNFYLKKKRKKRTNLKIRKMVDVPGEKKSGVRPHDRSENFYDAYDFK
jgi:hypothetical protein